jgi:glycosyltransferase involved in cell wall biosynthesis
MACGLPVVYSNSGGVPELVGPDAGSGVAAPQSWDQDFPPEPDALAEAVTHVFSKRDHYAAQARLRAETVFNARGWIKKHKTIFNALMTS